MKGFHLELVGPTMPILANNAQVDYSGMGSALGARSGGYFLANILGAVLPNLVKKHSDGLLAIAFILPAIGTTCSVKIQWKNIYLFCFSGFCHAICHVIDIIVYLIFYSRSGSRFDRFRYNENRKRFFSKRNEMF